MKTLKSKLTSRKFLLALSGAVTGIILIAAGSITEGTTALVTSIITYLVAEGYIDAAAVKSALKGEDNEEQ